MNTNLKHTENPFDGVSKRDFDLVDMEPVKRIGLLLFIAVFGIFGIWAAIAPIDSAAHGSGQVTVKTYKKLVQHLEGGLVSKILVQNGDLVSTGNILLELDNTQSLALLEVTYSQYAALKASEARLQAERAGDKNINFPPLETGNQKTYESEIISQTAIFQARKNTQQGSVELLKQRIDQLKSQLVGLRAQRESKELLANSYFEELQDIKALLSQGFSDKSRLREAERNFANYNGEAAEVAATIASTEVRISETQLEILQLDYEFQNNVATELGSIQTSMKDIEERLIASQDIVDRTIIRSPVSGVVNGMEIHTIGGVISGGQAIAEIVPLTEELIIEAQISPLDIDRVFVGQSATIRFPSFGSSVPTITGELLSLSADAISPSNGVNPYYLARVEVTVEGLEELGDLELAPGMPAEVFINTGSRTFLQYLLKPFSNAIAKSLIED